MKPRPLHLIVAQLNRMPLGLQIEFLRELLEHEKPYSVRHNELLSLLQGKVAKQLKRECKAA